MGLWRMLKRRMFAKVFAALGLVIGVTLLLQARADSRREARILKQETTGWAIDIAQLFIGAVEHAMLRGDGLEVKSLIEGLKQHMPAVQVHIYDQRGIEVFAPQPPEPPRDSIPAEVAAVLEQAERRVGADGRVYRPVPNEERCRSCHEGPSRLRGVISLDFDAERCASTRQEVLAHVVTEGFTHVMTAERAHLLDDYFAELSQAAPRIEGVAVFDASAELGFGQPIPGLDARAIQPLLARDARPAYLPRPGGTLALVPLPMQNRCVACHSEPLGEIRGVLALALGPAEDPGKCAQGELESAIDTSLRYIMLSQLGRRIADFLDVVAATGAVRELVLYDDVGRRYWTTTHPEPPPHVAQVLAGGGSLHRLIGAGMDERVLAVEPLRNRAECMRCHGSSSDLRGAVSVSLSTAVAAQTRQDTMRRRGWFTALTLLGILLVLGGLLQYLVARPVNRIGDVADAIGRGNLGVTVARADEHGDEIARLGQRINEMVRGLQAKMHLEKFVSRGAALAAGAAGLEEISRTGEHRQVTVLFSDIRGFTAYSEQVEPAIVVEMLNRFLQAQADVVTNLGGDIDKFVGDELMAVFQGPNAEVRAVLCAVYMIEAVHRARRPGESLTVGIGISAGEVVYGAIGHQHRMDFTVIGDVVNTGARLCSAAAGDEVIVSDAVRAATGEVEGIVFEAAEPLRVKGKRAPLPVFKARRVA